MNQNCNHSRLKEIIPGFFKCRDCPQIFVTNSMNVGIDFDPTSGNSEIKLVPKSGYAGAILRTPPDILIDIGEEGISSHEFKTQIVASDKFSDHHKNNIIKGLSNIIEL